jgi:hypothetical protein
MPCDSPSKPIGAQVDPVQLGFNAFRLRKGRDLILAYFQAQIQRHSIPDEVKPQTPTYP